MEAILGHREQGDLVLRVRPALWSLYHWGKSDIIAHYNAVRTSVVLAHVIQLERWSCRLSVMLEKTLGVTLVSKLWAILLIETGFNASNKIMYSMRRMQSMCAHQLMPEEIYSKKN